MHVATTPPRLSLTSHVRACECDGQVILLDLRRGRYLGIGGPTSAALSQFVQGWPIIAAHKDSTATPAGIRDVTQRFVSQGLMTGNAVRRPLDATIAIASTSLDFEDLSADVDIGARRIAHFLKSAALTAWRLRFCSLHAIALAVAARRERNDRALSGSLAAMENVSIAYERLRPFVFTSRQKCLYDSLTLIEFLAAEQLFPHWVVGVKTGPFGAHSWVQCGTTVLNDQHEYVRRFRPILVA